MRYLFALVVLALPLPAQEANIDEFFDRFTREYVRAAPQLASNMQIFTPEVQDQLDRELTPVTREFREMQKRKIRNGLAELKRFDRARLTPEQRVSAAILQWNLENRLQGEPFEDHEYMFEQGIRGYQSSLPESLSNMPIRNAKNASNYLARLAQVARRMDEATAVARERERKGIVPPKVILNSTIAQMRRLIDPEPAKTLWVATFAERLGKVAAISSASRDDLLSTAAATVGGSIHPAYRRAIAMLESQLPNASEAVGFSRLPNGRAAYNYRLLSNTTTRLTADEIHQLGLQEVARIEKEIDRLLDRLSEPPGPRAERLRRALARRPGVLQDEPGAREQHIARYDEIIRDAERRSADLFDMRPKAPVEVRRVPVFREANSPAYYTPPAPDGSRPGIFWTPQLGPTFYASRSLAYHEAVPGHHFQIALQNENQGLPLFRKFGVFRGNGAAYGEGWGLYAERLAREQGWYKDDPWAELDSLTDSDLFRARRLVVDTGLHAKGWTIEQGVEYGIRRAEVERYVTAPGQACSYKIGELKIVEMREKAKRELGAAFSLKEFHNTVLRNGSMPLDVLAVVVDEYIGANRK
ncbi:MAG: DUF885 domain-containing protein [Bryobacterales bacterium]|nr:DUF885 domain-containing protein [Bryobacterales bacterium]